jgi:hypothetical protein
MPELNCESAADVQGIVDRLRVLWGKMLRCESGSGADCQVPEVLTWDYEERTGMRRDVAVLQDIHDALLDFLANPEFLSRIGPMMGTCCQSGSGYDVWCEWLEATGQDMLLQPQTGARTNTPWLSGVDLLVSEIEGYFGEGDCPGRCPECPYPNTPNWADVTDNPMEFVVSGWENLDPGGHGADLSTVSGEEWRGFLHSRTFSMNYDRCAWHAVPGPYESGCQGAAWPPSVLSQNPNQARFGRVDVSGYAVWGRFRHTADRDSYNPNIILLGPHWILEFVTKDPYVASESTIWRGCKGWVSGEGNDQARGTYARVGGTNSGIQSMTVWDTPLPTPDYAYIEYSSRNDFEQNPPNGYSKSEYSGNLPRANFPGHVFQGNVMVYSEYYDEDFGHSSSSGEAGRRLDYSPESGWTLSNYVNYAWVPYNLCRNSGWSDSDTEYAPDFWSSGTYLYEADCSCSGAEGSYSGYVEEVMFGFQTWNSTYTTWSADVHFPDEEEAP